MQPLTEAYSQSEITAIFQYLDSLRESGITNMYGSPQYLQDAFDLDSTLAKEFFKLWAETFSRETSAEERAEALYQ